MDFIDLTISIPLEGYPSMLSAIREAGLKIVDLSFELFKDNLGEVEFDTSHMKVTVSSNEDFDKTSNLLKSVLRKTFLLTMRSML